MFYPIRELYKIVREYQVDIMPVIWVKTASWWLVMVWVGAPLLLDNALWRDAFTEHVVIGKIFVAKTYTKSELIKLWPQVGREFEAPGSEQRGSQS